MPTAVTRPRRTTSRSARTRAVLLGPNPGGADWLFNETEGDGEYFLVENRNQHGLRRLDRRAAASSSTGSTRPSRRATPPTADERPAGQGDPGRRPRRADHGHANRGDAGDPYPGSTNNHDLNDATTPNTKFHDGAASNLSLHVDDNAGRLPTMHVDVLHPGNASPPVIRPSNDMFANAVTITRRRRASSDQEHRARHGRGRRAQAGRRGPASVWYRWIAPAWAR